MRKFSLPPLEPQVVETVSLYNLIGGFNDIANQAFVPDDQISDGKNMVLNEDKIWTSRGGTKTSGQFLGPTTEILGLFEYLKPTSGARKQLSVYDTDIYIKSTGGEWEAQSQSVTTNKRAEFCNGNDKVYFTNQSDAIRNYDGTSWTSMANFPVSGASSSQRGKGLTFYKERIINWNTTAIPERVYYSDAQAETIGTNNFFDVFEPVTVCVPFYDYLLVFTENYIYRIGTFIFTGNAFQPNDIQPLPTNIGCISMRSAKQAGGYVYFLSYKGLCRTDGHNVEIISNSRIDNFIDDLPTSYLSNAAAGMYKNFYWIALSSSGTVNDRILVYDFVRNVFYPPFTGVGVSVLMTAIESGGEVLYGGEDNSLGMVYQFDQANIHDEVKSTDYVAGQDTDGAITASTTVRKAQSFQLSATSKVTRVSALLKKVGGTTTGLTVRIETNSSGVPSGTLANANATGTISAFTTTLYLYKDVEFSTPFELTASTTYWLVIQHTMEGSGTSDYAWGFDGSSPTYTSGSYASYASGSWTADADKDLLFRVYTKQAIEKYITTKGYYLGEPQYLKDVRSVFVETDSIGNWNLSLGVNTDLYSGFKTYLINLSGNAPTRGSTLVRGNFVRGTQSKIKNFIRTGGTKGRLVKLRFYNNGVDENFRFYGAEVNYITRRLLR